MHDVYANHHFQLAPAPGIDYASWACQERTNGIFYHPDLPKHDFAGGTDQLEHFERKGRGGRVKENGE